MPLARLLQWYALGLWSAAALLAYGLVQAGVRAWAAVALALALGPLFNGALLAIEFITGALCDRRSGPRLSLLAAVHVWALETWTWWRMFGWRMPFRAAFPEPPITPDPQRPAVLLIHGYLCNRAVWQPLIDSGLLDHCNLATLNLEPVFGSIDDYAHVIARAVATLRQTSGATQVTLVCHSMGGLAARAYLRQYGSGAIERVITLATPHAGTVFARFGFGTNTRQMRPGSTYLTQLAADTAPYTARFTCIGSIDDNLIVPRASVWLAGARHMHLERVGHLSLIADSRVHAHLRALTQRVAP